MSVFGDMQPIEALFADFNSRDDLQSTPLRVSLLGETAHKTIALADGEQIQFAKPVAMHAVRTENSSHIAAGRFFTQLAADNVHAVINDAVSQVSAPRAATPGFANTAIENLPLFGDHGHFHYGAGAQIVFVDPDVADLASLLSAIKPGMEVILLDPHRDALDQIAETLSGHHNISAVHIIADGMSGQVDFTSGALSLGNLTTGSHAADLRTIGHSLSATGDLMLWSCDTGAGATGRAFMDALAHHTGADVAASTDMTGARGDWSLEAHTGTIEATVPLTAAGIHQVDSEGLDLAALHIIYPTGDPVPSQGAGDGYSYYHGNYELGFSNGNAGGSSTDDLFPGLGTGGVKYGHTYHNYNSSSPTQFTVLGNEVVFIASDSTHGRELWVTDGTAGGTSRISDINPNAADAFPGIASKVPMAVVGSELFFAANDGTHGIELWKTDGSSGGTSFVSDIRTGSSNSNITNMVSFDGKAFFTATDGATAHSSLVSQIWESDGTTTAKFFTPTEGGGATYAPSVFNLTVSGDHMFFEVDNGTSSNTEEQLWVTDGTAKTQLTTTAQSMQQLTDINGTLYLSMNDGSHGNQMWTSDGTTMTQVTDIADQGNAGGGFSASNFVAVGNGEVFFLGQNNTGAGQSHGTGTELWETDGSAAGTQIVKDINPGGGSSVGSNADLTAIGNTVYFVANDGTNGAQLWQSDGQAAHTQMVNQSQSASLNLGQFSDLTNVNGTLYFTAFSQSDHHMDLWELSGGNFIEVASNFSSQSNGDNTQGGGVGIFAFLGGGAVVTGEPDAFAVSANATLTGQNLFNDNGAGADSNTGGSLSVAQVNDVALVSGQQIVLSDGSHLTVNSDGTFTFDPNHAFDSLPGPASGGSNLTGTETFTYKLAGASSDTTVTITVNGVDGNDTLVGTNISDALNPGTGNDVVQALGGADTISMGANLTAADQIDGGTGNDTVNLNGDYTDANAVVMNATTMVNVENLVLSVGHSYTLTTANATVASGQTLLVDGSALGSANALIFNGAAETDGSFVLKGGAGADSFVMGAALTAADQIDGGAGGDSVALSGAYTGGNALVMNSTTMVNVESLKLATGFSYNITTDNATVASGATFTVDGSLLASGNILTFDGSAETDGKFVVMGGAGADMITGGAGNDTLNGGGGADHLAGGAGNDIYVVNNTGVVVTESSSAGTDTVKTTLTSYTLGANLENLTHAGSSNFTGTGNTLANTITGGTGNDALNGGGGADHLNGGAGNDIYTVNNTGVVVTEAASAGTDTVKTSLTSYTLGANLENLTHTGSSNFTGTGNTLVNTITGGTGNDTLNGGGGADHLNGGAGNDIYVVNNTGVVVTEAAGAGTDTVKTNLASYTLGANVENLTYTGSSGFTGIGNSLVNKIVGGTGADTLAGGGGADTLTGGAGADHFVYSSAAVSTGVNYDTVTDFSAASDKFDVSGTVSGINTAMTTGALSTSTFDTNLAAAVTAAHLAIHHAVEFTPNSGTLAGEHFLIIDVNGTAGYQAGQDLVIHLTVAPGTLVTSNFI